MTTHRGQLLHYPIKFGFPKRANAGAPLTHERWVSFRPGKGFLWQCTECDEDFYDFECKPKD